MRKSISLKTLKTAFPLKTFKALDFLKNFRFFHKKPIETAGKCHTFIKPVSQNTNDFHKRLVPSLLYP